MVALTLGGSGVMVRIGDQLVRVDVGQNTAAALGAAVRAETAAAAADLDAAAVAADKAAILAAFAGYPGSGVLSVPVASRGIMAALTTLAGAVYLAEGYRFGVFVWNGANLSTQVTADPLQGIYVPPASDTTGASGAWVRQARFLMPEHFGATSGGSVDDLAALRNAGYWAATLEVPLDAGKNPYWLTGNWRLGSRTSSAAAAGFANHMKLRESWRFICDAPGNDSFVSAENCTGIRVDDMDFDINTASPASGHGQMRLVECSDFKGGKFTKIGASGSVPAATGGSVLSINGACDDVEVDSAIVEWAGASASAVFASFTGSGNPTNIRIGYQRCIGGQDACDLSGVDGFEFGTIEGYDLGDGSEGSIFDCGNSSNGSVQHIKGARVAMAFEVKTEDSGGTHGGCNNVHIGSIDVDDWENAAFRMAAGATTGTTEQTLHNITIDRINGTTTIGTSATRGIVTAAGDDVADPTKGLVIGGGKLVMNLGTGIEHLNGLREFAIASLTIEAPVGVSDLTPTGFTTPNNGLYENCYFTGPCSFGHDYTTFRNFKCDGLVTVADPYGCRMRFIEAPQIDIQWTPSVATEKNFELDGYRSINANGRALWLRHLSSTSAMTGVTIRNVLITDDQGSPTSTGFAIDNATTDWCIFENVQARGIASTQNRAIPGLNTRHSNVRFRDPLESAFGGGTVTIAYLDLLIKEGTASSNWALPSDTTSPIPIGSKIPLWANAASVAFTAGAGATMNGTGTVASGTVKTATKIATNEWLVS